MKHTVHIFLICTLLVACKQNTIKQQKTDITPQTTTKVAGQKVQDFVLEGHEILAQKEGDLNGDGKTDVLLLLNAKNELETSDIDRPKPRPLLLLIRQPDNTFLQAGRNDLSVLCATCGGVFGDPYSKLNIEGNSFSVAHFGGSNWKWTKVVEYQYDTANKEWYLNKVTNDNFNLEGKVESTKMLTRENFKAIKFKDYDIYAPSPGIKVGSSIQDVQKANGKPFTLRGFEIDRDIEGEVIDWKGGHLEYVEMQFDTKAEVTKEFGAILTDEALPSDHPLMIKARVEVVRISQ